jgi:ornithine lipid ester-linked acyl 2-hydroxylase
LRALFSRTMRSRIIYRLTRRIIDRYGRRLLDGLNRYVASYSLLGNPPVFDPSIFPWTRRLEENWQTIRDEAEAILQQKSNAPLLGDISPDHRRLDHRRSWRAFILWGYGYRADHNCLLAPRTAGLVDDIPGLVSVMFSVHEPGTHLPCHRGPTKGHLTFHLGLEVPRDRDRCRIVVEDQTYHWQPGRFLVFDDTCRHEVWNDSEEDRVILLLHARRPLRAPGRWVQEAIYQLVRVSPFVQDVRRSLEALRQQ